jgi:hypothetical protein
MEIVDGKIKEIRDYHQPVPAKAAWLFRSALLARCLVAK